MSWLATPASLCSRHCFFRRFRWYFPVLLVSAACGVCRAQADLPDAPDPASDLVASAASDGSGANADPAAGQQTFPPQAISPRRSGLPGLQPSYVPLPGQCTARSCSVVAPPRSCCQENTDAFDSYLKQNAPHIYTPRELGRLAIRGVVDPFNLLTIGATSAVSVATAPHSRYGPGIPGWGKLSGVTLTEDMTSEFVGTFLIPSIDHQDPHYHRMPNASLPRRIAHCIYQPFWTQSDTGRGMFNYSTTVGAVVEEAVDASYVPYQQVGFGASINRVTINWATMPIGNFVTEFVPDVARHINLNVVFLQRIINRVSLEESAGPQ